MQNEKIIRLWLEGAEGKAVKRWEEVQEEENTMLFNGGRKSIQKLILFLEK